MTEFEPENPSVGSDRSVYCASFPYARLLFIK